MPHIRNTCGRFFLKLNLVGKGAFMTFKSFVFEFTTPFTQIPCSACIVNTEQTFLILFISLNIYLNFSLSRSVCLV